MFFVVAWRRRIAPPTEAGVGFGLWLGSPVSFGGVYGDTKLSYSDTKVLLAGVCTSTQTGLRP